MYSFINELENCCLCPKNCGVNRLKGEVGYCRTNSDFQISSICLHKGEEPALGGSEGICNVFFSHCNLQCIYCQNFQISGRDNTIEKTLTLREVLEQIINILERGVHAVGFVSPSHNVVQVTQIIEGLRRHNYNPVFVWNSNAYDKPETLRKLESYIDVYLPDFKYVENKTGNEYSDAGNYPHVALSAIKEMYYQKGSKLFLNDQGLAEKGLIIRHLVLPGKEDESIRLLKLISEEISSNVTISLMSQYYPTEKVRDHALLGRNITRKEYSKVVEALEKFGFTHGWIQEFESESHYRPDFNNDHPFEGL